jgi:hypothetical protein
MEYDYEEYEQPYEAPAPDPVSDDMESDLGGVMAMAGGDDAPAPMADPAETYAAEPMSDEVAAAGGDDTVTGAVTSPGVMPSPEANDDPQISDMGGMPPEGGNTTDSLHAPNTGVLPERDTRTNQERMGSEGREAIGGFLKGIWDAGVKLFTSDNAAASAAGGGGGEMDREAAPAGGGVIPAGTEPGQGGRGWTREDGIRDMLTGQGALPVENMRALERTVDPQNRMDPNIRVQKTIELAQKHGGDAGGVAALQFYRQKYDAYRAYATAAMNGTDQRPSDLNAAIKAANGMMQAMPDGTKVTFSPRPDGLGAIVRIQEQGAQPLITHMDNQAFGKFLSGDAQFDNLVQQGVRPAIMVASNRAGHTPQFGQTPGPYDPNDPGSQQPWQNDPNYVGYMRRHTVPGDPTSGLTVEMSPRLREKTQREIAEGKTYNGPSRIYSAGADGEGGYQTDPRQQSQGRAAPQKPHIPTPEENAAFALRQYPGRDKVSAVERGKLQKQLNADSARKEIAWSKQELANHGRNEVAERNAQSRSAVQTQRNQGQMDVTNLRGEIGRGLQQMKGDQSMERLNIRERGLAQRALDANFNRMEIAKLKESGNYERALVATHGALQRAVITNDPRAGRDPERMQQYMGAAQQNGAVAPGTARPEAMRQATDPAAPGPQQAPRQQAPAPQAPAQAEMRRDKNGKLYIMGPNGTAIPAN